MRFPSGGMIELCEDFSFAMKPGEAIRISGEGVGEYLDGDVALQSRVAGAIDLAHSASAERGENFVRPESAPRLECHRVLPSMIAVRRQDVA